MVLGNRWKIEFINPLQQHDRFDRWVERACFQYHAGGGNKPNPSTLDQAGLSIQRRGFSFAVLFQRLQRQLSDSSHCCVHRCIWSTVRLGGCPGTQQGLPTGLSIQKALLRIVVEDAATLSWMLARPGSFSSASWSPHTSFTERPCKLCSIAAKFLKFIHSLPSPTALVTQKSTARN